MREPEIDHQRCGQVFKLLYRLVNELDFIYNSNASSHTSKQLDCNFSSFRDNISLFSLYSGLGFFLSFT